MDKKDFELLELQANHNYEAQLELAYYHYFESKDKNRYFEAVKYFSKAAEQNDPFAQFYLARCYFIGTGVMIDYNKAIELYSKSEAQGNFLAYWELAIHYGKGEFVTQDYTESLKWFRKSAKNGNHYAMSTISSYYNWGKGVEQDEDIAEMWEEKSERVENIAENPKLLQRFPDRKPYSLYKEKWNEEHDELLEYDIYFLEENISDIRQEMQAVTNHLLVKTKPNWLTFLKK